MRIGILGQPTIDEIILPGQRSVNPERALGGILYSYAAMERLMEERGASNDCFVPLSWLSKPDRVFLEPLLSKFAHLDWSAGLWPTESLSNRVQLVYQEDGHRSEHCPHILPPLTERELTPPLLESLDGLFVNMISGFDVDLETLGAALPAAKKRPYVHLDIHALVLGPLSQATSSEQFGGGREPRGVPEWRRWLALADSVQMNEFEARWLGDPEIRSEADLLKAIASLDSGERPDRVVITRAANGASAFDFRSGEAHHIPAPAMKTTETTGSGDVFGAVFTCAMLGGNSAEAALREAVEWATWNTTLTGINQILDARRVPARGRAKSPPRGEGRLRHFVIA